MKSITILQSVGQSGSPEVYPPEYGYNRAHQSYRSFCFRLFRLQICGKLVVADPLSQSAERCEMEIDKVITYSAIGVAGIVCLVFLLDLAAGIFGRPGRHGHSFHPGIGVPFVAGCRDRVGAPLAIGPPLCMAREQPTPASAMPASAVRRTGHVHGDLRRFASPVALTNPSQVNSVASTATFQPSRTAVAEVTGLRLASRTSRPIRRRAGSGSKPCRRSVIAELVNVIQSTVPSRIRSTTRRAATGRRRFS